MNLFETVNHIKTEFKQEYISMNEFDYAQNKFVHLPNPKFLFRGEGIYPTTKSNYHRLLARNSSVTDDLTTFVIDLSIHLMNFLHPNIDISSLTYNPVRNNIIGLIQHYGFPIMFLDFTENVDVAAFFASHNNVSKKGRICIIETKEIIKNNEKFIKLTNSSAKRPVLQEAFALRMFDDKPDLKNTMHFKTVWLDFDITENDINIFSNKKILSTRGDKISDLITSYIQTNPTTNSSLNTLLQEICSDLQNKKNWA